MPALRAMESSAEPARQSNGEPARVSGAPCETPHRPGETRPTGPSEAASRWRTTQGRGARAGAASDAGGPERDHPERSGRPGPSRRSEMLRRGRGRVHQPQDWWKTVVEAPTRLVRREGSCVKSAPCFTRRNDLVTIVPGVSPERRERPPETASRHAWSTATTDSMLRAYLCLSQDCEGFGELGNLLLKVTSDDSQTPP